MTESQLYVHALTIPFGSEGPKANEVALQVCALAWRLRKQGRITFRPHLPAGNFNHPLSTPIYIPVTLVRRQQFPFLDKLQTLSHGSML